MTCDELRAAGFAVSDDAYALLARFVEHLHDENTRVNLTGAKTPAEIWRVHVCDSLALVPLVREHGAAQVLDLGSGGGFPGVPLACVCPDVTVTLLDATRKKIAALERILAAVGLTNVRTLHGRAETLARTLAQREQFDVVAARAVGSLSVLIEYAAGFVRPGGLCCFYKSAAALEDEQRQASQAARLCALTARAVHSYRLPQETQPRVLVLYDKRAALSRHLPRSAGAPRKHPL
jgi:16S rRNA (guanine527-N7)-methyltransferase